MCKNPERRTGSALPCGPAQGLPGRKNSKHPITLNQTFASFAIMTYSALPFLRR